MPDMDRKGKTRLVLFCLFLLAMFFTDNGYIDLAKQLNGTWQDAGAVTADGADMTLFTNILRSGASAVMYLAWFTGIVIKNLLLMLLFRLVSIRKFDIVSKQEIRLSVCVSAVLTAAFLIYGIVSAHELLFPLCVNAGHLVAVFSIYILGLYFHSEKKMREKLLKT